MGYLKIPSNLNMAEAKTLLLLGLTLALANAFIATAGDPDILKDFLVPPGLDPSNITRQYFTYTGFRQLRKANLTGMTTALISKATQKEFPALEGQSVSVAAILYPPGGINPPHIHPRGSELLLVIEGVLEVGFIDTTNKLFVQTLQAPDLFIFPKGLVHFQVNTHSDFRATAIAMFGSSSAGTVSVDASVFGSGISPEILVKAFKTDGETISKLINAARH